MFQILTSAKYKPTNAMSMQYVKIPRARTAAHVKLDTSEMDEIAEVTLVYVTGLSV